MNKKDNFQLSIFNFQLIIAVLLLTVGCRFTDADTPPLPSPTPDSLLTPTGDDLLDSLLQVAATAPQDTNLAILYYKIGELYENEDFEEAKTYYLKLKEISEQLNWNNGRYDYAAVFANLLLREGVADSALMIFQQAYELAVLENNEEWMANFIFSKGNAYFTKEWYETALTCYMDALSIYNKTNNNEKLQQLYYMMSQLYLSINATEKAIEYGEKSIALNNEDLFAISALAMAYTSAHQYEKAKGYYEEALRLCTLQNNAYMMGIIYFHLGNDALSVFDLDIAEKYAYKALKINKQFGPSAYCGDWVLLSKLEQLKGNYDKSEEYAKKALQIALDLESPKEKQTCYIILSELAIAQGKYRDNVQYLEELDLIDIAMAREVSLRASEEMEAKYEAEKKELEIKQQQQIIARQNMQHWLLVGSIAVCVVVLVMLWHIIRLRNRSNLTLAEMNATKDKFFSIISHDLKNPAIAQRDALKMLVQNTRALNTETLAEYHNELLKSAEGEVELLFNLLNWAQLQTGKMTCTPKTFLISNLISNLSLIRKMAENKNITLDIQIPENALVTGDSNMLTTIVRNLLTNAIKFTSEGGQVSFCAEAATDGKYTISVSDTGVGMSPEHIRDLFRLESAHSHHGTAGETGTGLGLIVCKEFLEKHKSALYVESEKGKGSRFWFKV